MGFILSIFIAVISSRFLLDYLSKTRPEPSPLPPWARFLPRGVEKRRKTGPKRVPGTLDQGPGGQGAGPVLPGRASAAGAGAAGASAGASAAGPATRTTSDQRPGRPGRPATSDQDDQRPATRTTSDPAGPGRTRCADHGTRRPDQGPRARVRGDQRRALPAESSSGGELYQRRALAAESSSGGEL